jgi:hypothetical protein
MSCRCLLAILCSLPLVALRAEEPAADPQAEAMMRRAHEVRSRWGESFPGFAARVQVTFDGQVVDGGVQVLPGGTVELDLPTGPAADWAARQLESIAMHRMAGVEEHYDVSFADDDTTHPLGRLIRFHGGSTHTLYRIQEDVITEVHRQLDEQGLRFTITITDIERTAEGHVLPRHFNVAYWDLASGALRSDEDFQDAWVRVGDFELPARRLLVKSTAGGAGSGAARQVAELRLSGHELLPGGNSER